MDDKYHPYVSPKAELRGPRDDYNIVHKILKVWIGMQLRIRFKNPKNNRVELVPSKMGAFFLMFLFGFFYLAYRGLWRHVGGAILAAIFTGGVSWFIFAIYAHQIITEHYKKTGWIQLNADFNGQEVRLDN